MKSRVLSILFLSIISVLVLVAKAKADDEISLLDQLNETDNVAEKIVLNNAIGNKLRYAYPDSAMYYFIQTKILAQQSSDFASLGGAYCSIGSVWALKNNFDSAIYNINQCIVISTQYNVPYNLARANNAKGLVEVSMSFNRQAVETFKLALAYIDQDNDLKLKSKIFNNLGLAFNRLHIYDSSLYYYQESLKIKEKLDDKIGIGSTTNNIALIYEKLGDLDLTYKYLTRSLLIRQKNENRYGEAIVLNNFGLFYEGQGEYAEALSYYERSLDVMLELGRKSRIATLYNNIGSVYASLKNYKKAHEYLDKALALNEELGNKRGQVFSLLDLANFFQELRIYVNATDYYHQGLLLSKDLHDFEMISSNYLGLFTCFERMDRYDSALFYHKKYIAINDSIFTNASKRNIEKLEVEYESLKKEKENQNLLKENQISAAKLKQQYLMAAFLTGFLLFFIMFALIILRNRNQQKLANVKLVMQKNEIELQSKELKDAYSQLKDLSDFKEEMTGMIIHDLKNPINTIINIADLSTEDNEHVNLIKFSGKHMLNLVMNIMDVYRYEQKGMQLQLKVAELRYIIQQAYEEVRYNLELKSIQFIMPTNVDYVVNVDVDILERVFVNLFSNAIKFSPMDGILEVKYEGIEAGRVRVHVIDQGSGIEPHMLDRIFEKYGQAEKRDFGFAGSTGLGLTYCKLAIEAHDGAIGVRSVVDEGTDFFLDLKCNDVLSLSQNSKNDKSQFEIDIKLMEAEKELLESFIPVLEGLAIYQISEIKQVIAPLEKYPISNIRKYYNLLFEAVSSCDENKYEKLIDFIKLDSDGK